MFTLRGIYKVTDTPPLASVSVSWTQHQSSASPSPSQLVSGHLLGALASDQHNVPTGPGDITTTRFE